MATLKEDGDGTKDRNSFKIQEDGYFYFNEHLAPKPTQRGGPAVRQANKVVELCNPEDSLTLAANPGMDIGEATRIIGLATKGNSLKDFSLKDLVGLRLTKRRNPAYDSFEEFMAIRTSCHLVEEVNGDYFCDCREGIKGINQYSIKVYNQYSIKVHNHYSIKF